MTQEEKELLLKDLCARLPYGLKVNVHVIGSIYSEDRDLKPEIAVSLLGNDDICIKPYLRPMSSMTEEEHMKLKAAYDNGSNGLFDEYSHIDWLNAHHFDYRGLIPMGFALEATEEMYNM